MATPCLRLDMTGCYSYLSWGSHMSYRSYLLDPLQITKRPGTLPQPMSQPRSIEPPAFADVSGSPYPCPRGLRSRLGRWPLLSNLSHASRFHDVQWCLMRFNDGYIWLHRDVWWCCIMCYNVQWLFKPYSSEGSSWRTCGHHQTKSSSGSIDNSDGIKIILWASCFWRGPRQPKSPQV